MENSNTKDTTKLMKKSDNINTSTNKNNDKLIKKPDNNTNNPQQPKGNGDKQKNPQQPKGGNGDKQKNPKQPKGGNGDKQKNPKQPKGGNGDKPKNPKQPKGGNGDKPKNPQYPKGGNGDKPKNLAQSKKDLIESLDILIGKLKKYINMVLIFLIFIYGINIIMNLNYNGSEIKDIKKNSKNLEETISKVSVENESLEKEIEDITVKNKELQNKLNELVDKNFKAVSGTKWTGNIDFYSDDEEDINVSLDINEDGIMLSAKHIYWPNTETETEDDDYFDARVSLSSAELNKEKGYIKLNRLSLKNPPEGYTEGYDNILPYDYYIIFNDNYATGYLLDGSAIYGTMSLKLVEQE